MHAGYKAFISYSHLADSALAPALQTALERFAKPWYEKRTFRVFRDTTNLSIAPELWPEIEKAVAESDYLLLMASRGAAKSKWVTKEVTYWREKKNLSKLLIVLTDGEIAWDDACDDFDWSKTTALPERLRGAFDHEPLYLDFRQLAGGRLSLDDEQFLDHIATIAAPLHGTSKDAIFGEHIRQHRKTMRIAWSAVAALVALMFVAIGSTVSAVRASMQERAARLEAERQTRVARGQQLAAQAKTADVEGYHQRSLLLAAEALRVSEQAGGTARAPG
jgi:hypothetical protein